MHLYKVLSTECTGSELTKLIKKSLGHPEGDRVRITVTAEEEQFELWFEEIAPDESFAIGQTSDRQLVIANLNTTHNEHARLLFVRK